MTTLVLHSMRSGDLRLWIAIEANDRPCGTRCDRRARRRGRGGGHRARAAHGRTVRAARQDDGGPAARERGARRARGGCVGGLASGSRAQPRSKLLCTWTPPHAPAPALTALKAAQADSPLTQPDRYPDLPAYARKIEDLRRRLAQVGSSLGATFQRLDYLQEALTDFARTQAAAQRLAMQAEQQAAAAATAASSAEAAEPGAADRAHPAPIVGDAVPA